jgi:hypothetical protein
MQAYIPPIPFEFKYNRVNMVNPRIGSSVPVVAQRPNLQNGQHARADKLRERKKNRRADIQPFHQHEITQQNSHAC